MLRSETRQAFRPGVLRVLVATALVCVLAACATVQGVLVPVAATVPDASRVDMLVATTRKRADPAEMFSGARGLTPGFANITVSTHRRMRGSSARSSGRARYRATRPRTS
jgi:esterase/lipase superfamily enzyme